LYYLHVCEHDKCKSKEPQLVNYKQIKTTVNVNQNKAERVTGKLLPALAVHPCRPEGLLVHPAHPLGMGEGSSGDTLRHLRVLEVLQQQKVPDYNFQLHSQWRCGCD